MWFKSLGCFGFFFACKWSHTPSLVKWSRSLHFHLLSGCFFMKYFTDSVFSEFVTPLEKSQLWKISDALFSHRCLSVGFWKRAIIADMLLCLSGWKVQSYFLHSVSFIGVLEMLRFFFIRFRYELFQIFLLRPQNLCCRFLSHEPQMVYPTTSDNAFSISLDNHCTLKTVRIWC